MTSKTLPKIEMKSAGVSSRRLICDCSLRFSEESLWGKPGELFKGMDA